jgi:hypothetical protein
MSTRDKSTEAYYLLRDLSIDFKATRAIAHLILTGIGDELRAKLPDAEQIRWEDVLFITIGGQRVFFQFRYRPGSGYINFGQWYTNELGHPRFNDRHRWEVEPGWKPGSGGEWLNMLQQKVFGTIVEILGLIRGESKAVIGETVIAMPLLHLCTEAEYTRSSEQNAHPGR